MHVVTQHGLYSVLIMYCLLLYCINSPPQNVAGTLMLQKKQVDRLHDTLSWHKLAAALHGLHRLLIPHC
jgi:hypothetical protein